MNYDLTFAMMCDCMAYCISIQGLISFLEFITNADLWLLYACLFIVLSYEQVENGTEYKEFYASQQQ